MPMSQSYKDRLFPILPQLAAHYGTPFHIYDEAGIRATGAGLNQAFASIPGFREYYAVKALPNPRILEVLSELGFGFDCSSIAELMLSRQVGARGEDIMFTSNNTSTDEYAFAEADGGSILNLDDISLIAKVPNFPELICFRYNPGPRRTGNIIIGNPWRPSTVLPTTNWLMPTASRASAVPGALACTPWSPRTSGITPTSWRRQGAA